MSVPKVNGNNFSSRPVNHSYPVEEIKRKILSIEARQIDLMSKRIGESIINNLGPIAKARIAQKVYNECNFSKKSLLQNFSKKRFF